MKSRIAAVVVAFVMCLAVGVDSAQAVIKSWRKVLNDKTLSVAVMPSPIPGEPSIILAGTNATTAGSVSGIRKSVDGGATWATAFRFHRLLPCR